MNFVAGGRYQMNTSNGLLTGDFVSEDDTTATFNPWSYPGSTGTTDLTIDKETIVSAHRLS